MAVVLDRRRDGSGEDSPGLGRGLRVPRRLAHPRGGPVQSKGQLEERGEQVGAGADKGEYPGAHARLTCQRPVRLQSAGEMMPDRCDFTVVEVDIDTRSVCTIVCTLLGVPG